MQAQLAWRTSLEAAQRKGQGSGISKGLNEDDVSSESMVSLLDKPGLAKPKYYLCSQCKGCFIFMSV